MYRTTHDRVADWLAGMFSVQREWPSKDLFHFAEEAGFNQRALFECKKYLPIGARKQTSETGESQWSWVARGGWPEKSAPVAPEEHEPEAKPRVTLLRRDESSFNLETEGRRPRPSLTIASSGEGLGGLARALTAIRFVEAIRPRAFDKVAGACDWKGVLTVTWRSKPDVADMAAFQLAWQEAGECVVYHGVGDPENADHAVELGDSAEAMKSWEEFWKLQGES